MQRTIFAPMEIQGQEEEKKDDDDEKKEVGKEETQVGD